MEDGRRRALYEETLAGKRSPRYPDVSLRPPGQTASASSEPESLEDFRDQETDRSGRLRRLFDSLSSGKAEASLRRWEGDDEVKREEARQQYVRELYQECGGDQRSGGPTYARFVSYVEQKERELFRIFHNIDYDRDYELSKAEMRRALQQAGMKVDEDTLAQFFRVVDKDDNGYISFREWRDVFILMPRQSTLEEIFAYYAVSKAPRHSATVVTSDGDSVTTEPERKSKAATLAAPKSKDAEEKPDAETEDLDEANEVFSGAGRSFLAGGIAGAVSRTATAPFDRLKVYLINTTPDGKQALEKMKDSKMAHQKAAHGLGVLKSAVKTLYRENGWRAFFVGNGLNIVKIFPESAIKYASYETSKRAAAKYWDHVDDPGDISGGSRFVAGGIGGITSQFSIYWIETLKTRCMSSTSSAADAKRGNQLVIETAKKMWREGGIRAYFRGLTLGLIGVFPYSAIDMSLYDGFRKAYVVWSGNEDPPPMWSMAFGATSGGLGASLVYPLNLVRTRLQTQGSTAHPQTYPGGYKQVIRLTLEKEGYKGLYKGLTPTLLKVAPSVGLSWMTFELARSALFKAEVAARQ